MWNISIREFVYFRIGRKSTYFSWGLVFIAYCLKQKVYVTSRDFRAYPDFTLWLFSRFWTSKWKKWLECAWNFSNTLNTPWKQFTATVKYYTKQNAQNQSLEKIHGVKRSRCEIISRRKIVTPCYYKHHSELNHCTLSPNQASVTKNVQITTSTTEVKSLQSVLNIWCWVCFNILRFSANNMLAARAVFIHGT